jgi:putative oxidoreductase
MSLPDLRRTRPEKPVGIARLTLGVLFMITGGMKLLVPGLAQAWAGQLVAAQLPLYELTRWSVPFLEVGLGIVLLLGLFARVAAVLVLAIMAVATYVHLVVADPALFPLQPTLPVVPLAVMALGAYLLWRGAGSWSLDLKATEAAAPI